MNAPPQRQSLPALIASLWCGTHDLHDTFWRYTIMYGLVINMVTALGFMGLIAAERPILAALVGYGIPIPYNAFALVAVWRAASNYRGPRFTAEFMRITALLWLTMLTVI